MAVQRRGAGTKSKDEDVGQAAFRFALRQFLRFSETAARKAGLTPQQYQGLLAIHGFPERDQVSVGELAERLRLQHHSTVGLIDRLGTQGLAGWGKVNRRREA